MCGILSYVRRLFDEHLAGRADHSHRLWTLLTFEVWLGQMASPRAMRAPCPPSAA